MNIPVVSYYRLLRTYLLSQWPKLLLLTLLLSSSIGLQLYSPMLLKALIDGALAGKGGAGLISGAALFLGAALLGQVIAVWASYVSQQVGWEATNALRADLTLHTLRLDLSFHKSRTPGEMIERIDGDVSTLSNFFSQFVVLVASNAVLMAGVLLVLYWVDIRAGLALTGFAAASMYGLGRTRHVAMPGFAAARQSSAEFFGFLGERLAGLEEIRANGGEGYVLRGFFQHMRSRLAAELKAARGVTVMLTVSFGLLALGITTAFGVGAYLVSGGAITVGTAYMIFYYTEQLRRPVEQITGQMQDLARASASIVRIQELLNTQSQIGSGAGRPLPGGPLAVAMERVSFGYEPGQPTLTDISLQVAPGQVLGVVGRTGSGKSTIMSLLTRLYEPDSGRITLGDENLADVAESALRQRVCVVTQEVHLLDGTLRDNLTLYDPAIGDEGLWTALAEVGLRNWAESLPQGLDTVLAGGAALSAGEKQLLALARAFVKDCGLVVLDEASSRLDPVTEQRMERAMDRLLRGRTAILIAHRLSTLQRADSILVLDDGHVAEFGARASLAADPASRYHALLHTQAEVVA